MNNIIYSVGLFYKMEAVKFSHHENDYNVRYFIFYVTLFKFFTSIAGEYGSRAKEETMGCKHQAHLTFPRR